MGALGAIFIFFAPQIMSMYTDDPQMIAQGAAGIRVVALAQPLWAGSFVFAGALRGTGNTRLPLVITGVAMWAVVGLGFLAVTLVQQNLVAIWTAFLIVGPFETAAFALAWRWWRRSVQ